MIRRIGQGCLLAAFIVFLPAVGRPEAVTAVKMWCLWLLGVLANTFQPSYKPIDPGAPTSDEGTANQILWSVYVTQLAAILEALYLRYPSSLGFDGIAWAALAVMIFGLILRTHAVWTLGVDFTWHVSVRQDQRVIDTGPYRFIRHPGYAGAWLTYVGTTVFLGTWYACALAVPVLTAAFVRRIRLEEAALETRLGDAYVLYAKRTSRLCPGIW